MTPPKYFIRNNFSFETHDRIISKPSFIMK
jgi:hypothetical protein